IQVIDHNETLRRIARLATVVEAGIDGRGDRGIHVDGAEQYERVRPAQLKHNLLHVPTRDLGDRRTRSLRARERHTLNAGVTNDARDLVGRGIHVRVRAYGAPASSKICWIAAADSGHCDACLRMIVLPITMFG